MRFLNSAFLKSALGAAVIAGSLAAASAASADVVCNRWGDCWRVRDRLDYPANAGVSFHDDAWAAAHRTGHWRWRTDRSDRGYYRNGVWIAF